MQFGVALKRMKVGDAIKTPAMGGYFKKIDNPNKASEPNYPYRLVTVDKDGLEGTYNMTEEGEFDVAGAIGFTNLYPALLTQIANGDWDVMTAAKAERERTNPKVW